MNEPENLYVNAPHDNVPTIRRMPTSFECRPHTTERNPWGYIVLTLAGLAVAVGVLL